MASAPPNRRAFTLLEMIVVILVLAILGTLIVPRLTGNQRREFRLAVDKTGDLLTMFGQRQNLGQEIVGITHNRDDNSLALIEIDSDSSGFSGWRYDAYVKPLRFPAFMSDSDVEFFIDGDPYDASEWPLSSEPGQQRPSIEIHLRGPDESATVILSPHGVSPLILDDSNSSGMTRQAVDLDGEGRGREDW